MHLGKRLLLLALLLLMQACGTTASTQPTSTRATDNSQPQPTLSKDRGAVTGVLLDREGLPIQGILVFLGTFTEGTAGQVVTFLSSSPSNTTDAEGHFTITNAPPGSYVLGAMDVDNPIVIAPPDDPQSGALAVDVRAGELIDVGTVRIDRPQ